MFYWYDLGDFTNEQGAPNKENYVTRPTTTTIGNFGGTGLTARITFNDSGVVTNLEVYTGGEYQTLQTSYFWSQNSKQVFYVTASNALYDIFKGQLWTVDSFYTYRPAPASLSFDDNTYGSFWATEGNTDYWPLAYKVGDSQHRLTGVYLKRKDVTFSFFGLGNPYSVLVTPVDDRQYQVETDSSGNTLY
ncbi:MAG: hypothetical protein GX153_13100 [Clostridiaceae bacterium]|nr:hypothetical protein [Clostridiaceae bacterium]